MPAFPSQNLHHLQLCWSGHIKCDPDGPVMFDVDGVMLVIIQTITFLTNSSDRTTDYYTDRENGAQDNHI